jgi:Tol biopolymer transport system component
MRRREFCIGALAALSLSGVAHAGSSAFGDPQDVTILGYGGSAMEPFISRNNKWLLFNNRNDPADNTDLHWAERKDDLTFSYRGKISGANSPTSLDATPSMSAHDELFFVSTRSYSTTFSTIYHAHFEQGATSEPTLVEGVSRDQPGWVNFDLEISADGKTLYFVDSYFGDHGAPQNATLVIAKHEKGKFRRLSNSAALLANINGSQLVYAPAISADECELFFTRVAAITADAEPAIFHSTRTATNKPFGVSKKISTIQGFAEGPSISFDGKTLYFHHRHRDGYKIRAVRRTKDQ